MMRPNAMKARLKAGEPALGMSVMIPSPQMVEMAAGAGFDWVLIDCEHGTITRESAELMIMAAEASGITPIVRPRTKAHQDIVELMDCGAAGVQVPHVITADDARAAVAAVKFHPAGKRSLAAGTRASGYGYKGSMADFTQNANKETLIAVQIEDEAALANVDEILKIGGIDVFFIGPSDLSASMGHPGNPKAEPVAKAIDDTLKKIVAVGKTPGMPATTANLAATIGKGVRYIYTHAPTLLGAASAEFLKAAGR
ncbi:MAG TPA: aldolase/citrate lyase family protein [Pseudolabrys sp.]|jgi:4-hydroxy-2-oxoheptanedioate aldolase|nr:aldolase/citrate lyase family protein [Pseudolabrys sp.]